MRLIIKTSENILANLFYLIALLNATSLTARPEFFNVYNKLPNVIEYLFSNQIQVQSKVSDGIIFERRHPAQGGIAEKGIEELLQYLLKKYDSRFSEGVSAYWTLQISLARNKNNGSKWYSYANSLPDGIQTIKIKRPVNWLEQWVRGWTPVEEKKVIVY